MSDYVYRGMYRRVDSDEWMMLSARPYEMKHHAKLRFPKNLEWVPEEKMWFDRTTGYCYKVQRTNAWEDVE